LRGASQTYVARPDGRDRRMRLQPAHLQEAAAAEEAAARDPVLRMRKALAGKAGGAAADAARAQDVEGGLGGRMRVVYQVRAVG